MRATFILPFLLMPTVVRAAEPSVTVDLLGFEIQRNDRYNQYFLRLEVCDHLGARRTLVGTSTSEGAYLDKGYGGNLAYRDPPRTARWQTDFQGQEKPVPDNRITVEARGCQQVKAKIDDYFLVAQSSKAVYRYTVNVVGGPLVSTNQFTLEDLRNVATVQP